MSVPNIKELYNELFAIGEETLVKRPEIIKMGLEETPSNERLRKLTLHLLQARIKNDGQEYTIEAKENYLLGLIFKIFIIMLNPSSDFEILTLDLSDILKSKLNDNVKLDKISKLFL